MNHDQEHQDREAKKAAQAPNHGPSKGYHAEPAQAIPGGAESWDWDARPHTD